LKEGRKIGCKWVFKEKYNANVYVKWYKDHFVVNEYSQVEGVDYEETFFSLVKMTSIRLLLALLLFMIWRLK
jgi:hypothetical protein